MKPAAALAGTCRRRGLFMLLLTVSVHGQPAMASPELAQRHNCFGCHAVDKEVVGPAYKAVARRYKGRQDAQALVVASILAGGSGKWGPAPMPAQTALSEAQALSLARWILSLAH